VTVTNPAVMGRAWSGSFFIIFSDMNFVEGTSDDVLNVSEGLNCHNMAKPFHNIPRQCRSPLLVVMTEHRQFLSEICFQIEVHQIIPKLPLQISIEQQPTKCRWVKERERRFFSEICAQDVMGNKDINNCAAVNIPSKSVAHLWLPWAFCRLTTAILGTLRQSSIPRTIPTPD
jgi:hypothetical protein